MKRKSSQVVDHLGVHARLELKVEVGQGAPERETGKTQSGGQLAVERGVGLLADDPGQVLDVAPFSGLGLLGQEGEAFGRAQQAEIAQVVFELLIERVGHGWALPVS
jgi:hypothetical protein